MTRYPGGRPQVSRSSPPMSTPTEAAAVGPAGAPPSPEHPPGGPIDELGPREPRTQPSPAPSAALGLRPSPPPPTRVSPAPLHTQPQAGLLLNEVPAQWVNRQAPSPAILAAARHVLLQVEDRYLYRTLATPLAMCRAARASGGFAAVAKTFASDAEDLLQAYNGGTCFSLAEKTQALLTEQLGLVSVLVADDNPVNVLTLWPSPKDRGGRGEHYPAAFAHMGRTTHVDVAVLFDEPRAGRQVTLLRSGMGNEHIPAHLETMPVLRFAGRTAGPCRELDRRSVATLHKLSMFDRDKKYIFGIDLLRGHAYLNRAAQAILPTGAKSNAPYPFRAESSESLVRMLGMVEHAFAIPAGFVEDVLYLISHHEQYLQEVLLPRAATLAACVKPMERVGTLQASVAGLAQALGQAHPPVHGCSKAITDAAAAADEAADRIDQERGPAAEACFLQAERVLTAVERELVREVLAEIPGNSALLGSIGIDGLKALPATDFARLTAALVACHAAPVATTQLAALGPDLVRRLDRSDPLMYAAVKRWHPDSLPADIP